MIKIPLTFYDGFGYLGSANKLEYINILYKVNYGIISYVTPGYVLWGGVHFSRLRSINVGYSLG